MSAVSYCAGVLAVLVVVGTAALVAVRLRRLLVPGLRGAPARLVELLLGHVTVLVLALLLGSAGLLARPALVVGALVVGALVLAAIAARKLRATGVEAVRHQPDPAPADPALPGPAAEPRAVRVLALVGVGLVAAQWLSAVPATWRTGILAVDALHYHLTFTAHFAQSGSTTELDHLSVPDVTTYYPLNDELLQATALLLLGADTLSLVLGLLALAGTLLAAYCLGARRGAGATAVLATCVVLALTGSAVAEANDWQATWPLLAGLAVLDLRHVPGRRLPTGVLLVVGLAGGLAVGTRLNLLPPAAVLLGAAVWLAGRGARWRALALLLAGHVLAGGYWYVRNLLAVGNPLPQVELGVGPLSLPRPPMPALDAISFSVAGYLTDAAVVREWFLPSLPLFLGPAWPVLLLAVAAGLLGTGLRTSSPVRRAAAVAGVVCGLAYLVTPTSAGGLPGMPFLFVYNIRYALVSFVLGLLLLATCGPARRRPLLTAVLLLALLAVTLLGRPDGPSSWPLVAPLAAAALVLVVVVVARAEMRRAAPVLAGCAALLVVAGLPVQHAYLESRYRVEGNARQELFAAVQDVRGAAIAVVGFPLQYPFFGPDLENTVSYLGRLGDDGGFTDHPDCRSLLEATRGLDYVVVERQFPVSPLSPARDWMRADPAVREVFSGEAGSVFALDRPADPSRCPT